MKKKLTLSIDENTFIKARQLLMQKKKSLSKLFEEYVEKNQTKSDTPITDSLTGILKDEGKSYDEIRYEALKEKHGLPTLKF
jgi:hypothetical protein